MIVLSLFIIGHMELFFYTEKGSIISVAGVPTTDIIEPIKRENFVCSLTYLLYDVSIFCLRSRHPNRRSHQCTFFAPFLCQNHSFQ